METPTARPRHGIRDLRGQRKYSNRPRTLRPPPLEKAPVAYRAGGPEGVDRTARRHMPLCMFLISQIKHLLKLTV
jgi:hypothetical protein